MSQIETIDELFATNNPESWKTYIPLFIDLYVQKSSITALAGGVTTPPETQTGLIFDRLVLKKDRSDESYTRPIRIYVT